MRDDRAILGVGDGSLNPYRNRRGRSRDRWEPGMSPQGAESLAAQIGDRLRLPAGTCQIPAVDNRSVALPAEDRDRAGPERKHRTISGRQAKPSRGEDAEEVAV